MPPHLKHVATLPCELGTFLQTQRPMAHFCGMQYFVFHICFVFHIYLNIDKITCSCLKVLDCYTTVKCFASLFIVLFHCYWFFEITFYCTKLAASLYAKCIILCTREWCSWLMHSADLLTWCLMNLTELFSVERCCRHPSCNATDIQLFLWYIFVRMLCHIVVNSHVILRYLFCCYLCIYFCSLLRMVNIKWL